MKRSYFCRLNNVLWHLFIAYISVASSSSCCDFICKLGRVQKKLTYFVHYESASLINIKLTHGVWSAHYQASYWYWINNIRNGIGKIHPASVANEHTRIVVSPIIVGMYITKEFKSLQWLVILVDHPLLRIPLALVQHVLVSSIIYMAIFRTLLMYVLKSCSIQSQCPIVLLLTHSV